MLNRQRSQTNQLPKPILLDRRTVIALVIHVAAAVAVLSLASCAPAKWHESYVARTGDRFAERQTTTTRPQDLRPGFPGYVNPVRLRGYTDPNDTGDSSDPVVLNQNDPVVVDDPTPKGDGDLVKVHIPEGESDTRPPGPFYIPAKYIAKQPVKFSDVDANKYFVVENIASEKLRVYERCTAKPGCAHRLVLETDMVVGEETPDHSRRSIVGSYVIDSWAKFYQDQAGQYPSWVASGAPIPAPGASLQAWTGLNLRGAFGWYTAKLRPNAREQWTHGTWGDGADGDRIIETLLRSPYRENLNIASHGCTRVENQAIALMHELLPAGTKLIKIYAKECYAGARKETPAVFPWSWTLTKEGAGTAGASMAQTVSNSADVLDQGAYSPNTRATAVEFLPNVKRAARRNGNVYDLPQADLRGVFLVDSGRLQGYVHPSEIARGGFTEKHAIPGFLLSLK